MKSPLPPKILNWPTQIPQHYSCNNFEVLITGGCSFTASTCWLDGPASWPGFVKYRCNIPVCIDLSYPGVGNEYIANSILAEIEDQLVKKDKSKIFVLISWSGLDRKEELSFLNHNHAPKIDDINYSRADIKHQDTKNKYIEVEVWKSWKNIVLIKNYLENKQIAHAFFSYCNLLDPPFLPKRDSTPNWPNHISDARLNTLRQIPWAIPHSDSLFEFCFMNDFLGEDFFHPTLAGIEAWTDTILLPNLQKQGYINSIIS
jgi:hypothetical protein